MKKRIYGYELSVIITKEMEFTEEEADTLSERILNIFEDSDLVNIVISPLYDEEEEEH